MNTWIMIIILSLFPSLTLSATPTAQEPSPIPQTVSAELLINGSPVALAQPLLQIEQHLFVPIQEIGQIMGATAISWCPCSGVLQIESPTYSQIHQYLSYLGALLYPRSNAQYELPDRVKELSLPPYPLESGSNLMLTSHPIELDIADANYRLPFAAYDYLIHENTLYLTTDWLNTIFLADTSFADGKLYINYPTKEQLEQKIHHFEDLLRPITPEETLALWVLGQQDRSGALQYIALSPDLQRQVLNSGKNWVTGGSSPSAGNVTIEKTEKLDHERLRYHLIMEELLHGIKSGEQKQTLVIAPYMIGSKKYWLIQEAHGNLSEFTILGSEKGSTAYQRRQDALPTERKLLVFTTNDTGTLKY